MIIPSRFTMAALILVFGLPGCSNDIYRSQSESLQIHALKFQSFLHREQVDAAMHENHAIELIGLQLKSGRLPGSDTLKPADLERAVQQDGLVVGGIAPNVVVPTGFEPVFEP